MILLPAKPIDALPFRHLKQRKERLRIPGSHNSKCVRINNNNSGPTTEVKIIRKWDGNRPAINWVLRDFRRYLIQEKIENVDSKRARLSSNTKTTSIMCIWIEILLETPIEDFLSTSKQRCLS